ncbi:ATP-binding cassette domain-containing protein [Nesterenkonia sp. NBAIMH1]|uniref:ATP-binding cassette domain-containing protein n=1 Tax=Nesterenkonia sp. NBAIMH1 TaxID=2600320 RepID=UPI0011B79564|nr:ATP-binding cassette domain-containing protein [Nesterenkonia sp. NBAIMH1]
MTSDPAAVRPSTRTTTPQAPSAGAQVLARGWTWHHPDRDSPAVAGLDLHIRPGEKVLIAGPSGAGKSTLLHGLAGVLQDQGAEAQGDLLIDGARPEEARGRAGLMQQDPEAAVVLSRLSDDVAFGPENLAVPRDEIPDRVAEALRAVGLGHLPRDHPTAQLSGGQKQRLALAGILAMRPGLLLLDEPTANLDPEGADKVRDAVIAAAERTGATLVVVEHRLARWAEHMDTLVVLAPGSGVSRRAPSSTLSTDGALRTELAEAGLWVPGWDGSPRSVPGDAEGISAPAGGAQQSGVQGSDVVLRAEGLAVSRHSPRRGWRRRHCPAPVLTGVNLTLSAGRAVGITGPNGAGKSTLLLSLAGLLPPHAGTLTPDPHAWNPAQLISRIGMVFQEPEHQFVKPTVAEELRLSAEKARTVDGRPQFAETDVEARVAQLLHRLRLEQLADANPFSLSGGEKRRLSVGTALASGPQMLLLDEPTFGQDAHTFAEIVDLLREHLAAGGAVLAVTHDAAFLEALDAETVDIGQFRSRPAETPSAERGTTELPGLGSARNSSWLGRRSPLAKLAALALITLALVATIDAVSAAVVAATSFLMLGLAGIRPLAFLGRIWPFAVGAVIAVWGTAIAGEESGRVLLDLGFTTVSSGSLLLGVALGLRAFAIVLPSVIILSTTDPTDLADSLAQQLKLPARFVLGALAAMRLMGLLAEHWSTLGHARRARGIGAKKGLLGGVSGTLSQAFGLLVQAIRTATRLAITMESRGFGAGPRTWARPARLVPTDALVVLAGAGIAAAATAASLLAGTWNLVWA